MSPLIFNSKKIAVLIIYRENLKFLNIDKHFLEYFSTIISIFINYENFKFIDIKQKDINDIKIAINTLSFSELDAIIHICNELNKDEGIFIASKIADKCNISKSIIVNAIKKLESARILEARSLGAKGTYVKIFNKYLFSEIDKLKG